MARVKANGRKWNKPKLNEEEAKEIHQRSHYTIDQIVRDRVCYCHTVTSAAAAATTTTITILLQILIRRETSASIHSTAAERVTVKHNL